MVAAAKYLDDAVAKTQAANTLVRRPDGQHAYNTDYQGVLDSLKASYTGSDKPEQQVAHPHG